MILGLLFDSLCVILCLFFLPAILWTVIFFWVMICRLFSACYYPPACYSLPVICLCVILCLFFSACYPPSACYSLLVILCQLFSACYFLCVILCQLFSACHSLHPQVIICHYSLPLSLCPLLSAMLLSACYSPLATLGTLFMANNSLFVIHCLLFSTCCSCMLFCLSFSACHSLSVIPCW